MKIRLLTLFISLISFTTFASFEGVASKLCELIKERELTTIYEGLPNSFFYPELHKKHKKEIQLAWINGFPYYLETLSISDKHKEEIKEIFVDITSYAEGPKEPFLKLGGDCQPDFCIVFEYQESLINLNISFSCHEITVKGSDFQLYCDLTDGIVNKLIKILRPYKNYPIQMQLDEPDGEADPIVDGNFENEPLK